MDAGLITKDQATYMQEGTDLGTQYRSHNSYGKGYGWGPGACWGGGFGGLAGYWR